MMTTVDYNKKYLDQLKKIVLSQIDTKKIMVFLFGSRACGQHASRSDVDIGLLCHGKLPPHLFHKIRNAVDDSMIPWKVDIIDFTRAAQSFKKSALKDIIVWNKPDSIKIN